MVGVGPPAPARVQPQTQRRRQLVEQVAAQVGQRVAPALGCAVAHRHEVGVVEGRPFGNEARAVRAVLGRKRHRRVGEVVQLGERGVQVGQLGPRRGRVFRRPAVEQAGERRFRVPQLLEQAAQRVAEVRQEAAAASRARDDVDPRHVVAQREPRLAYRPVQDVRVRGLLDCLLQAGGEPQIIVRKGEPAQCPRPLRFQRTRQGEQLLARQPLIEVFQLPAAVVGDRLQRQVVDFAIPKRHLRRAALGLTHGVNVRIDIEELHQRHLVEVAEAVEKAAAQLDKGAATEAPQPDDKCRPQRARLRQGHRYAQRRDLFDSVVRGRGPWRAPFPEVNGVFFRRRFLEENVLHRVVDGGGALGLTGPAGRRFRQRPGVV